MESNLPKTILVLCNGVRILYLTRFELIEALRKEGYEVFIGSPSSKGGEPFEKIGCHILATPLDRRGLSPFNDLRLARCYKRVIKDVCPDVLLTFTIKPNVYGSNAGTNAGVPAIATITGVGTSIQRPGFLQSLVFRLCRRAFRRVSKVFFQNRTNSELFRILGLVRYEQMVTVPGSGVNLERNRFIPYPDHSKPVRFLFIGRLMKEKGVEEYLEAARYFQKRDPEVRFGVLGGTEESEMRYDVERAAEEGLIDYYGYQEDVRPFIADAFAVVLPSWHEGMANVLLEAAAAGRPVIASNISGCAETFNEGTTGYGFAPRNVEDLCAKLELFCTLPYDEKAAMGTAGRVKMEHEFDRQKVVDAYLTEISRLCGSKNR